MLELDGPSFGFIAFGSIIFIAVLGVFGYVIVKGLSTWMSNNAADIVTEKGKVVSKRTQVWGGGNNTSASTSYFVTFELEDGHRMELPIKAQQYGLLAEGDVGDLTYQGTRFKAFERQIDRSY